MTSVGFEPRTSRSAIESTSIGPLRPDCIYDIYTLEFRCICKMTDFCKCFVNDLTIILPD